MSSEFGYIPKGKPGQKSPHYITFTNKILGPAIEQLTGELPIFDCKNTARRDSSFSIRAIYGWQEPSQNKVPNPNRKCKRLPIDDEMRECGDINTNFYQSENFEKKKLLFSISEWVLMRLAKRCSDALRTSHTSHNRRRHPRDENFWQKRRLRT